MSYDDDQSFFGWALSAGWRLAVWPLFLLSLVLFLGGLTTAIGELTYQPPQPMGLEEFLQRHDEGRAAIVSELVLDLRGVRESENPIVGLINDRLVPLRPAGEPPEAPVRLVLVQMLELHPDELDEGVWQQVIKWDGDPDEREELLALGTERLTAELLTPIEPRGDGLIELVERPLLVDCELAEDVRYVTVADPPHGIGTFHIVLTGLGGLGLIFCGLLPALRSWPVLAVTRRYRKWRDCPAGEGLGERRHALPDTIPASPQPETEVTLRVGPDGDHATLGEAFQAAPPGARILLAPGTYRGNLSLSVSVTIEGPEPDLGEAVLEPEGDEAPLLWVHSGADVTLARLRLDAERSPEFGALRVEGASRADVFGCQLVGMAFVHDAELTLSHCALGPAPELGLYVGAGARAALRSCSLFLCQGRAAWIEEDSLGLELLDSEVLRCARGIEVCEGVGEVVVRGCRFEQNNATAFHADTGSSGVFEGNRAAGNASFGWMFQVEKDWQRKDNRCFDNPLQADEPRQVGCLTLLLG